jgi:hypothetical protein
MMTTSIWQEQRRAVSDVKLQVFERVTAKLDGIDPQAYLAHVLEHLPSEKH